ncbi:MAG: choice-of-anchor E domain-containing protein [Chitinophagales bacterium]
MKKFYSFFLQVAFLLFMLLYYSKSGYTQCPNGQPAGATAFDTTIDFGAGIVNTQVKFPKFDPSTGMVTCVKLCVTIKGIIDTVALENLSSSGQTASYSYSRRDTITGPGIPTYLTSGTNNLSFGPFALAATDGVFGSGPDFFSVGPDTVLTKVLCANINDSATIAQFYGVNDSVTYNYAIDANAIGVVSGGSYFSFVLSSALVNFHFSYCTCPSSTLPLDVHQFTVNKAATNKAQLSWNGFDDLEKDYHYEIQLSHNGNNFTTVDTVQKNSAGTDYKYIYTTGKSENTRYFFRIKQVYSNGYPRFSEVKFVDLENSDAPKINIYPNPSNGVVGIKFVNVNSGKFLVQISNTQGQTVFSNEVEANDGVKYITTLQRGMYWLRLIDVTSHLSCVNQLLIK